MNTFFNKVRIAGLYLALIFLSACTASQINKTIEGILGDEKLSTEEIGRGLKEALIQGIRRGAESASKTDGFFKNELIKIPFPPEISKVETRLRQIGLGSQVDRFVKTLNRGAEKAAKEATPIFTNAIRSMTINDARDILQGSNDAATRYLIRTTSKDLKKKFQPIIKKSLESVNATKYYTDLINAYNKIPGVTRVNPDLDEYATERAVVGLFTLVAQEELNIRENPQARTTELLKKVFSQQD